MCVHAYISVTCGADEGEEEEEEVEEAEQGA